MEEKIISVYIQVVKTQDIRNGKRKFDFFFNLNFFLTFFKLYFKIFVECECQIN